MKINKLAVPDSEDEVKSHWKYIDKVYVSIVCITFNQEHYISDAIDSFLAQKTNYCFEIIIHDDASTDKTRDILKTYQTRYPSLIKLVLQEKNQYSLGEKITPLAIEKSEGEFIAICEGDDFWISEHKIQLQIEQLINHPQINLCVHPALKLNSSTGETIEFYKLSTRCEKIEFDEVIYSHRVPDNEFAPPCSFFFKRVAFNQIPQWVIDNSPVFDFYLMLYLVKGGEMLYLADTMSSYRYLADGSWTVREGNVVIKALEINKNRLLMDLDVINDLGEKYKKSFKKRIGRYASNYCVLAIKSRNLPAFFFSFYFIFQAPMETVHKIKTLIIRKLK